MGTMAWTSYDKLEEGVIVGDIHDGAEIKITGCEVTLIDKIMMPCPGATHVVNDLLNRAGCSKKPGNKFMAVLHMEQDHLVVVFSYDDRWYGFCHYKLKEVK